MKCSICAFSVPQKFYYTRAQLEAHKKLKNHIVSIVTSIYCGKSTVANSGAEDATDA